MNYALLVLTALVTFTWGMLLAFYLIFVHTATKLSHLLSRMTGEDVDIDEAYQTIKNIVDRAYEDLKKEECNEAAGEAAEAGP